MVAGPLGKPARNLTLSNVCRSCSLPSVEATAFPVCACVSGPCVCVSLCTPASWVAGGRYKTCRNFGHICTVAMFVSVSLCGLYCYGLSVNSRRPEMFCHVARWGDMNGRLRTGWDQSISVEDHETMETPMTEQLTWLSDPSRTRGGDDDRRRW